MQGPSADSTVLAARLALLQSLTARLAAAGSEDDVARVILEHAQPGVGAEVAVVAVLGADGRALRNIGFEGVSDETRKEWTEYPLDSPVPVAEAALRNATVLVRTRAERNARYPVLAAVHGPQHGGAVIALPLRVEGRLLGVLGLCFPEEREFADEELQFFEALAGQCALAVERAKLARSRQEAVARLHLASNAAGFGIFEWHPERDLPIWENARMYEIFARDAAAGPLSRAEFERDVVHPDDLARLGAALARLLDEGEPTVRTEYRVRAGGDLRRVEATLARQPAAQGATRVVGVVRDVTEERQASDALREVNEVLTLAMRSARMGAWSRDIAADRVWWSPELEELFGLAPGGFEGSEHGFFALVHEDDRPAVAQAVARALQTRTDYLVEFRFRHASGEWRWMDGRGRATYAADGAPVRLYGVGIDITERKRAEEALRKSEERLRLTYQATGVGAWEWNAESNETYWSPEYRDIYGHDAHAAPTFERGMAVVAEEDRPAILAALQAALREGAEYRSEHRIAHPARGERWIQAIGRTLRDAAGAPRRMVGVVFDVTERRRAEEQLREADRRKDEFLAILAHELRNPLSPILNAAQILGMGAAGEANQQAARDILGRQVTQMARLIDDLMDVSRVSRGKLVLRRQPCALAAIVEQSLEIAAPQLHGRDLHVALPAEALTVHGDPVRLAQVFSNLLNNAGKFTPAGGRVAIEARRVADEVRIEVSDSGIGIAPERMASLFRMFSQGPALERTHGGLGIGLALSKALLEMHSGRIQAESAGPGRGSRFVVTLPLSVVSPSPPQALPEAGSGRGGGRDAPARDFTRKT